VLYLVGNCVNLYQYGEGFLLVSPVKKNTRNRFEHHKEQGILEGCDKPCIALRFLGWMVTNGKWGGCDASPFSDVANF
jgi:hypothetical protein